ncbi:DUF4328 domain-containing protein [Chloroflexota bacterium]
MTNKKTRKAVSFESGHSRAQRVAAYLLILIVVNIIAISADYSQVQLVGRAINGQAVTLFEAAVNDNNLLLTWGVQIIIFGITVIALLMWVHRVYRNLQSLGADNLMFSPGWAVGGFFIPIWNLLHPFLVVREIWKASDPSIAINDSLAWKNASLSCLATFWWLLFVASWFIVFILNQWSIGAMSLQELYAFSWVMLPMDGLTLLSAVLTILLVWSINHRQKERNNLVLDLLDVARNNYTKGAI